MQIQVNGQQPQTHRQRGTSRMTLHEYLESNNLKRRIKQHSKSKQSKNKSQSFISEKTDTKNQNNIMDYLALNLEWKSRKTFTSWIESLKQLCRAYISNDSQYIEVSRKIQEISSFVKDEIEQKRKENLVLQSYMVTEASYWQESQIGQRIKKINPSVADFQHTLDFESPNKRKIADDPKCRENPESRSSSQIINRAASQPKKTFEKNSIDTFNKSSTHTKTSQVKPKANEAHFFSFKDGSLQQMNRAEHAYQNGSNSHPNDENMDFLKLDNRSSNDQVPRLSLMSRFDENKARNQLVLSGGNKETEAQEPPRKQKEQEKAPLRERRQKSFLTRPPDTLNFLYKEQEIFTQVDKAVDDLIYSVESPLIKSKRNPNSDHGQEYTSLSQETLTLNTPSTFNRTGILKGKGSILKSSSLQLRCQSSEGPSRQNIMSRYEQYHQKTIREATQQQDDEK